MKLCCLVCSCSGCPLRLSARTNFGAHLTAAWKWPAFTWPELEFELRLRAGHLSRDSSGRFGPSALTGAPGPSAAASCEREGEIKAMTDSAPSSAGRRSQLARRRGSGGSWSGHLAPPAASRAMGAGELLSRPLFRF